MGECGGLALVREDRAGRAAGGPVVGQPAPPGSYARAGEPLKASKREPLPKTSPPIPQGSKAPGRPPGGEAAGGRRATDRSRAVLMAEGGILWCLAPVPRSRRDAAGVRRCGRAARGPGRSAGGRTDAASGVGRVCVVLRPRGPEWGSRARVEESLEVSVGGAGAGPRGRGCATGVPGGSVAGGAAVPPGPIPNPVVTRRSAGEYCGGDPAGGEAAAGPPGAAGATDGPAARRPRRRHDRPRTAPAAGWSSGSSLGS
ncbi:MAG: hypothetical protein QOF01_2261 [Thermomicrobiales bacterium]|nr:hypothetical protein [Thermomicrobiales bacterium]